MASVPFVDDEEEQKDDSSLYAMDPSSDPKPPMPANEDEPQRVGPDGDGDASNNGSAMPRYTPQQSGSTNPENTSPALSGQHSSGADPLAGSLYEPPPTAPKYTAPDRSGYKTDRARLQQDEAPLDRSQYKPSVGNYIQGALVGALAGALGRDEGQGRKIVTQRYDKAAADQTQRVAADKDTVAGDRTDISDAITDSDKENEYYKTGLDTYKAGQEAQGKQWDRDHTNRQDTQSQNNWDAQDEERKNRDLYEETHGNNEARETVRHNQATEKNAATTSGYEDRRVKVEEQRLKDEEAAGDGLGGSPSDQRIRAQNAQKYEATRQDAYKRINNGDPKAADEYSQKGYKQSLQDLQTSTENPNTGEAWKPGEQDAAVTRLKQQHLDDLNKVESDYVGGMRGMGYKNIQPIQFNDEGEATTDSSGRPLQRQQVGGAGQQPVNPGQAGGAKPSAVPPAQAPPQTFKTKSGQQVSVGQVVNIGGRPVRITGFNQQTGKPTGVPVAGQ